MSTANTSHSYDLGPGTRPPAANDQVKASWLLAAAMATIVLWQVPFGNYILYPFTILATWFHEMGHGLTALLLGGNFEKLMIYPDGSGVAYNSVGGGFLWQGLREALVAAGGPMGPPVAGALFILSSRRYQTARYALICLSGLLLLSTVIWIRSLCGWVAMPALGLAILLIALRAPRWAQGFAVQFIGVQACVSTFRQLDYLFTAQADIGGQLMPSDSSQIAQHLLLPYWFWGGLMAAASLLLLILSLRVAYRPARDGRSPE